MRYYPVYLDLHGRDVLVVGGGAVGSRKTETLLRAGARVTVVSPQAGERLRALARAGRLTWHARPYVAADMEDKVLVFCAAADPALSRQIEADAARHGVLCNLADAPQRGHFILPSIVERGDLLISISTSGTSPAVARRLRKELEAYFGEEYGPFLRLLGRVRETLLAREHAPEAHKELFGRLIDGGLLSLVRTGDRDGMETLLKSVLGDDVDTRRLLAGD